ncbi:MAG: hypothetical protein EXQ85_04190 [Alphaproteobacteria bacterium]|nr:hypothetical protein [Alphaproteobacteria bacterium]
MRGLRAAVLGTLALVASAQLLLTALDSSAAERNFKPHFVSLRHATVNVRAGPGTRYPIAWVYKRAGLPVEALAEFDNWYRVRDIEGDEGWIHRRLLSSDRTTLIAGATRTVRNQPRDDASPVLFAEMGVVARLLACKGEWCRINVHGRKGWLPRDQLWGAYPREDFD